MGTHGGGGRVPFCWSACVRGTSSGGGSSCLHCGAAGRERRGVGQRYVGSLRVKLLVCLGRVGGC